jgi:hypothetical protein
LLPSFRHEGEHAPMTVRFESLRGNPEVDPHPQEMAGDQVTLG